VSALILPPVALSVYLPDHIVWPSFPAFHEFTLYVLNNKFVVSHFFQFVTALVCNLILVAYTLLGEELHQLLDIDIHQVNRCDFAGMGSDAHDKILTDSIDDEEAVVVTANRESSGMAGHLAIIAGHT
jgi:hypothetical protein